jgi:hypothetical protein
VSDWDDHADQQYWRGVNGPKTSDFARAILRRDREHQDSPEGIAARMRAHPVTSQLPEEAIKAYIDRLPKREDEPSISDLISERGKAPEPRSGFAETAVGPDRAALRPTEPQEALSVRDQGTLPPEKEEAENERERFCACGCGQPVHRSNQRYVNTRHRQRDWVRKKRRHSY